MLLLLESTAESVVTVFRYLIFLVLVAFCLLALTLWLCFILSLALGRVATFVRGQLLRVADPRPQEQHSVGILL